MGFANVEPTISVVIPAYNCDRTIERAIKSVLQQEHCDYELLVIDCGSSDRTLEIVATYSQELDCFQQQEPGIAQALNRGISLAEGDLIAFLAADDYFLPDKLASQAAVFVRGNSLGIVDSGWQQMGNQQQHRVENCPWESLPQLNLETWLYRQSLALSTIMFRREWLQYVGGFEHGFPGAEAWDLVLRLAYKGCHAAWLKQVTVGRQNEPRGIEESLQLADSLFAVADKFFAHSDLPATVRLQENNVRYQTLVWAAWYLVSNGHRDAAMEYLKKTWSYRSRSATETIISWIESFARWSDRYGIKFDANSLTVSSEWQQLISWAMEITDKTDSN